MKKFLLSVIALVIVIAVSGVTNVVRFADKRDAYEISKGEEMEMDNNRFVIKGNISEVSTKNGFVSYAVNKGNLQIFVDETFEKNLFDGNNEQGWHGESDKSDSIDGIKLSDKIGTGAILVQTSKDGKSWITDMDETDIYNKMGSINKSVVNGEEKKSFYETTNVQLTNGCYYRIIVAYKLQKEEGKSVIPFVAKKNTEEKIEVYKFYAFDSSVEQEELNKDDAFEFGDVYRVDSQDGFENPKSITSEDPHNDWSVGKFYVSGYTDCRKEDVPVFLKVPSDRVALWFNLEQELDKCNGNPDVMINSVSSGSDTYFGTPTISELGKGTLIIRKTDKQNKKERQIYTNFLEASATVGANTRVDLFEEGDYEVALDYQLHYDKPFVFGTKAAKTLSYRIFFKFKVRNGDVSVFLRDIDTDKFITNANVAEHGFYIDVANSQYLNMSIKREVLTDSRDGLIEDTKFSGVAKVGRDYTDEGIYTITVTNTVTGDIVQKKVYVGNEDLLRAYMATGLSLQEINERIAAGAYIDENGQIVDAVIEEEDEEINPEIVNGDSEDTAEAADETEENEENSTLKDKLKHLFS